MKRLLLALFLVCALSACSIDTVTGPGDGERGLEPTDAMCNRNVQLC